MSDFKPVVDELWSAFEEMGIEDGYDIIGQATLLLAVRRLDVLHIGAEKKANLTGQPIVNPIFDTDTDELRWSRLKNIDPETMFTMFESKVVQFIRQRGGTFADAIFTIPTPAALSRLVDLVDKVPYSSPQENGAFYEYLISKIITKNSSGGFPTPRHLIDLMVRMTDPQPTDVIADPASGTGGSWRLMPTICASNTTTCCSTNIHGNTSPPGFCTESTTTPSSRASRP